MAIEKGIFSSGYSPPVVEREGPVFRCASTDYWLGRMGLSTAVVAEAVAEQAEATSDLWLPGAFMVAIFLTRLRINNPPEQAAFEVTARTFSPDETEAVALHCRFIPIWQGVLTEFGMVTATDEVVRDISSSEPTPDLTDVTNMQIWRPRG